MSDLISRQAAIDSIQCAGKIGKQTCISILKRLPSVQPEQRWIPCSERLPEKSGDYVATFKGAEGYFVDLAYWNETFGGRWQAIIDDDGFCDVGNVIAWMPLPRPYKAERRVDEQNRIRF